MLLQCDIGVGVIFVVYAYAVLVNTVMISTLCTIKYTQWRIILMISLSFIIFVHYRFNLQFNNE